MIKRCEKNKMTIICPFEEAKERGLDNCQKEAIEDLESYAKKRKWKDYSIVLDAKEESPTKRYFLFSVALDKVFDVAAVLEDE